MASTRTSGPNERQERFLRLFQPAHDRLARFAHAMTRDRDEARDLVGDTVLAAYEHFDELTDSQAFVSWIFTIARRITMRKRKREQLFRPYDEQSAMQLRDTSITPEDAVDLQLLFDALATLPRAQREAVTMFEIAGLSLEEIRAVQGGSLSGVKSRVARGRQTLAAMLGVADAPHGAEHRNGQASAVAHASMATARRDNG